MNIYELVVLSLSLCIDSFSSSVSLGVSNKKIPIYKIILVSVSFSIFQSLMPLISYLLSNIFEEIFMNFAHIISFVLLTYLGIKTIKSKQDKLTCNITIKSIIILSIAISLDAFTIGITYSLLNVSIILATLLNFFTTFISSIVGIYLGLLTNTIIGNKGNIISGLVLISLGIKIFLSVLLK